MRWFPLLGLLLAAPASAQTYDDLMRYPQQYRMAHVSYSGRVEQVMPTKDIDGEYYHLRVKVGPGQVFWVLYRPHNGQDRILEGDAVDFRGWAQGTREYTAVLGNRMELPFVVACELTAHAPGGPKFVTVNGDGCRW